MARPSARALGYVAAWLGAAAVAVTVGLVAVSSVGASVRDRGPLTAASDPTLETSATPDPAAERREDVFDGDYGSVTVACQGALAFGIRADPAAGWTTVLLDTEADDDIEAVFSSGPRSIEIEFYCDGGRPTVSDFEDQTLSDDD
ncbi:hypothetical protein [Nocardioides sp. 1609]|uniref:hypothetical protein n=1 Tax=Nocardioides sp. 1609 TaxID=2508327 RepID=UPI00106F9772|nr:hypothetical protein [Nocardioides sp. 1609]